MYQDIATKVLTGEVRLSYVNLITPKAQNQGDTPMWNNWFFAVQKADDRTNYETRKEVEDSCRAMIASYTSDKLTYEQYKDSDNEEKQSWAEQARMRANKTAASYNEYVLKNSFPDANHDRG